MTSVKELPHDLAAEEAVIGSLLLGANINEAGLTVDDFYSVALGLVYKSMLNLHERNELIDQITVASELAGMGKLAEAGGAGLLSNLVADLATSYDLRSYAKIVKKHSVLRQVYHLGEKIQMLTESKSDPKLILAQTEDAIVDIRKHSGMSTVITPQERQEKLLDRYTRLHVSENSPAISTGMPELDSKIAGGLFASDLVLIGARTNMGKTTFLQTIANNVGRNHKVLFCSGEMDVDGLSDRDVAGLTQQSITRIRLGQYDDGLYSKIINHALPELAKRQVYFYEENFDLSSIYQVCLHQQVRGLDLVIIDYLRLIDDEYGKGQYERISYISRKLKKMAKKLKVPIIVAHQLNRDTEKREDKHPQLSDLRDSGALEEDADVVLFLYRASYYDHQLRESSLSDITEVCIAKVRQSKPGTGVELLFDEGNQRYCEKRDQRQGVLS